MKRQLYLNDDDTERFYEILNQKKQLITRALYKVHIPPKQHQDFDRIAFTTIKRKLIDEIRYRNKDKSIPLDIFDNNISDATDDNCEYLYIQLLEYIQNTLDKEEFDYFCEFVKTLNIKLTAEALNISLSTAYRLHRRIRGVCEKFLLEY